MANKKFFSQDRIKALWEPSGEPQKNYDIRAPVIIDALLGAGPLLDFVQALQHNDTTDIAAAESERLSPYMNGFSRTLFSAMDSIDSDRLDAKNRDILPELVTPEGLAGLFNAMARYTRNTLLSEVVIVPSNIISYGPTYRIFEGMGFRTNTYHSGYGASFGFVQIYDRGSANTARHSTTFGVFMLSSPMVEAIMPFEAKPLLENLQRAMTIVNHDMLHHYTSPLLNSNVAARFDKHYCDLLHGWKDTLPKKTQSFANFYEQWAQITYEKIMLAPGNEAAIAELESLVDGYFEELDRIRNAMMRNQEEYKLERVHNVVDYFGMMMAQSLSRLVPLNHPLMMRCLGRIEQCDPMPDQILADCAMTFVTSAKVDEQAVRTAFKDDSRLRNIVQAYLANGLDIIPEDKACSYQQLKMLQLIAFNRIDIAAHIPAPLAPGMAETRSRSDEITLKMLLAAAGDCGYRPS